MNVNSGANILVEAGWDVSVDIEGAGRTVMGVWSIFRWRATAARQSERVSADGFTLGEAVTALYDRVGRLVNLPEPPP